MRHLILLILSILLTGCSVFIRDPQVTVKDVNLVDLDGGGVTIELHLSVSNPNSYDLKLLGYSYNLNLYALPMAQGVVREAITFPGDAVTEVRLPVKVSYKNLIALLKGRPDPDNVPYQLSAGFDVETPFGTIAVPVEKKGAFAIPKQYRADYYLRRLSDLVSGFMKN